MGTLADRHGQRLVLLISAALHTAAVVSLILAAAAIGASAAFSPALFFAAFVSGASCPQVGPLARVRWMALTSHGPAARNKRDLDTALSYESTADEVTFVLGPALVGILASLVAPWLPLVLAAVLTATLVPAFAVHHTHRAVPAGRTPAAGRRAGRLPALVILPVLAMVCMGTFFGSTQSALSSFSAGFAGSELAGLLYAVMGLSSAAAALSVAYWPQRFSLSWRWLLCAAAMAVLAVLLLVPSSMGAMVAVLLILGIPVGPVMVTVFAVGGAVAPAGRLGTVMTALASGIVAGTALVPPSAASWPKPTAIPPPSWFRPVQHRRWQSSEPASSSCFAGNVPSCRGSLLLLSQLPFNPGSARCQGSTHCLRLVDRADVNDGEGCRPAARHPDRCRQ